MSETKWTPGPWTAQWDDNGYWYIEPLGVTGTKLRGDSGECLESANARLIAAAPELYEALERTLDALVNYSTASVAAHDFAVHDAYAALTKARGEAAMKQDAE